jgi:hypothetical protein
LRKRYISYERVEFISPEESDLSKKEMTQARVLKIEKGNAITLPGIFVDGISESYGLVIMVVKDKNVKVYPVESSQVFYLKLGIEKLSKSFLEELTAIFEEAGLEDILFTSGICQAANQCFYECYFTPEQLQMTIKDLEKRLNGITGVQEVKLVEVPLE